MQVDVGTGDGRAVLASARRDPDRLVIGLDAAAGPLAEASRRAARPGPRGGLPNALFVVAGIEAPPDELVGRADLVSAVFPWGSLLAGVLGVESRAMTGLVSLVAPGGSLEALVSIEPRDRLAGLGPGALAAARLQRAWAGRGFVLVDARPAESAEIAAAGSSWAKRLGAASPGGRSVMRLRLSRLP